MRRGVTRIRPFLLAPTLALLWLALSSAVSAFAQANSATEAAAPSGVASVEALGVEIYRVRCAVCHGETGLGLDEAKQAFPADHRRCQRCHRPGNPPVMSLAQIEARQHDLFDIGVPPPLRGEGALAATAEVTVLRDHLAATMPRYRPGALTAEEYEAVALFLLRLNGRQLP